MFGIFLGGDVRTVGGIGGDVGEEGFFFVGFCFDPAEGGGEEDIGTEAFSLDEGAIVADDRVVVFVVWGVGAGAVVSLADAAGTVHEGFVEAALVGLVFVFIAEVPFAEDARGVAGFFEGLGEDGGVEGHALALEDGVGDAVFFRMASGHEGGASRGAGGGDHEMGEAGAGIMEGIEVGGFQPGVTVAAEGREALVIGDDEDDVGAGAFESGLEGR